jgi:hypothetical protein
MSAPCTHKRCLQLLHLHDMIILWKCIVEVVCTGNPSHGTFPELFVHIYLQERCVFFYGFPDWGLRSLPLHSVIVTVLECLQLMAHQQITLQFYR